MAQLHKLGFEAEIKCSADKYFGMFSNNVTQLPKFVPSTFKSVEITEGDGTSIGSTRLWKYAIVISKDRLTTFNKEKRSLVYEITQGGIMNYYKVFNVKIDVVPKQHATGNGSLVKWSLEFEKVNDDIPDPTAYIDAIQLVTNELSSQLC
ncbi:major latex protein 146-like [Papaver somniferum]|uniref:major latex protein 146-like n=1 Tax=Papaver somniferum TaxID=3469 RepID=UPI000E6F992B|nr:major latex protein 146-like [Papaver somniferum]